MAIRNDNAPAESGGECDQRSQLQDSSQTGAAQGAARSVADLTEVLVTDSAEHVGIPGNWTSCGRAMSLREALTRTFSTPAYLVCRKPIPFQGHYPRIKKDALAPEHAAGWAKLGGEIIAHLGALDWDAPKQPNGAVCRVTGEPQAPKLNSKGLSKDTRKATRAEAQQYWETVQRPWLEQLIKSEPRIVAWQSLGGARLLWVRATPIVVRSLEDDAKREAIVLAEIQALQKLLPEGAKFDSLKEFERYQRLPHDTRPGQTEPTELDFVGDIDALCPYDIFDGNVVPPEHVVQPRSTVSSAPNLSGKPTLMRRLLAAAGLRCDEFKPGMFDIECPCGGVHSETQPRQTVLYENDGKAIGGIHCMSNGCTSKYAKGGSTLELGYLARLEALVEQREPGAVERIRAEWRADWPEPTPPPPPPAEPSADAGPELEAPPVRDAAKLLADMNAKHAVLSCIGGKCRVLSWSTRVWGRGNVRQVPAIQSFEDFRNRYSNQVVAVEGSSGKLITLGDWWLRQPQRRQAETLCFRPDTDEPIVEGCINIWRGYTVKPKRGDWTKMRQFMFDVIASKDVAHYLYIYRWCAWVLQNPGGRAETALVLRGKKGTGKNTLLDALCKMLGQHALQVSSPRHLTGNFNAHLQDCALLFANEAVPPADKPAESVLKSLVTEATVAIERKGVDVEQAPNVLSICMASNESWCVPAGLDERRFAVFNVSDCHIQDQVYFGQIHDELNAGGLEAMLDAMLRLNLGDWHPRQSVPKTAALVEQQLRSLREGDRIVYQMLEQGRARGHLASPTNPVPEHIFVATEFVAKAVGKDAKAVANAVTSIGEALAKCCEPGAKSARVSYHGMTGSGRVRGYYLPPLKTARANWAAAVGLSPDWGDEENWIELESDSCATAPVAAAVEMPS